MSAASPTTMVARYSPLLAKCSYKLGQDGDDGRAIRMAMGAGADIIRMDAGEVAIPLTPPRRLMRGILVNRAGQRFINEDTYYGHVGMEVLFRQRGRAWLLHDASTYSRGLLGARGFPGGGPGQRRGSTRKARPGHHPAAHYQQGCQHTPRPNELQPAVEPPGGCRGSITH